MKRRLLISVAGARKELGGISNTTFYELVKAGDLPTIKIGRRTFVATSELDAFVKRQSSRMLFMLYARTKAFTETFTPSTTIPTPTTSSYYTPVAFHLTL